MYSKEFNDMAETLFVRYVSLKNLQKLAESNSGFANEMLMGKRALCEARRVQKEFFPFNARSEEIVLTLLNQKFVYDNTDYSDETDEAVLNYCDAGLMLYAADALADEIGIINKLTSDLEAETVF